MDDLDDKLAGRDRADDIGADRARAHPVDEIRDDRQRDIGLDQRGADILQRLLDIGLAERTAPA